MPPRSSAKKTSERAELVERLDMAGRVLSTAAIMFHTALSEKRGLSASEEKALDLLDRFGAMSAGELSEKSGLAPASVTGLIDRLERKGFAKRVPDANDGRRVRVEVDRASLLAKLGPLFHDFVTNLHTMYEGYSNEELKVVLRFIGEVADVQRQATERLRDEA